LESLAIRRRCRILVMRRPNGHRRRSRQRGVPPLLYPSLFMKHERCPGRVTRSARHSLGVYARPALRERHPQNVEDQGGAHAAGELSADDPPRVDVEDEGEEDHTFPAAQVGVGVGPRRDAGLSAGPFPGPALRNGRAALTASGSPRIHAVLAHCVATRSIV
jgi:hypothetical protein